ncbi:hypothetical protein [Bradyrhizobium sp. USDA 4486]
MFRLPVIYLVHQCLGPGAYARRHGARQHRIDGRRWQDAGDADRRQEPHGPTQRARQDPLAKTNGDVYISIVPFAKAVNIGASNYKYWIDFADWDAAWTPANHNAWTGCVVDRDQSCR